jgi:selenocysteine lyase/cysteine desulfurase
MVRGERVLQLEHARQRIADGLKLRSQNDLAIVRNASEGNNAISCGYRNWNTASRENVVLWSENHPTNLEAWRLRAEWGRPHNNPLFTIRLVSFPSNASDQFITNAFIGSIDNQTRFVSFSETANSTGFRIPERVISNIWERVQTLPNCHVHIDGTMSWGARSVDLSNPRCHSFVSSAHKWFLGPKETGILYMAPDKVQNFVPSIFAYDYKITVPDKWQDMPNNALRFELIGQRDDVNIITLAWTQMMWDVLEGHKPDERVAYLAQYLMGKLLESGWALITPQDPTRSWGVVRVHADQGGRQKSLYDWLYDNVHIAGSGNDKTFRLCPHIYNTLADIDRAVEGMNTWRRSEK